MLLLWDFKYEQSKSEIILKFNLCFINILFKEQSASSQDDLRHEMDLEDLMEYCYLINYEFLSIEDPKTYPKPLEGFTLDQKFSPDDDSCIVSGQGDLEPFSFTIQDCDCSDPKNYDFYDKGRFKI